jgi:hypothetical protein
VVLWYQNFSGDAHDSGKPSCFSIVNSSFTFSTETLIFMDAMIYNLEHSVINGLMLPGKSSFLRLLTTTLLGSTLIYERIQTTLHLILYFMLPQSAFQVSAGWMHVTIFLVLISFLEYTPSIAIQQHVDEPANSSLLRIGLLGCSPLQPTVTIRLQCLELYRQI